MDYSLAQEPGVPTYDQGNILDLAFASPSLTAAGIAIAVYLELESGSDHRTLFSRIDWDPGHKEPLRRLKASTIKEDRFRETL